MKQSWYSRFIRNAALCGVIILASFIALSCGDEEPAAAPGPEYGDATAIVDYANVNNAVFFDFSTGTMTTLPHDFFDIAINTDGKIIANSGSYGSGVTVYKTDQTDITGDFSGSADSVIEHTLSSAAPNPEKSDSDTTKRQTEQNPLGELEIETSNVCLIGVKYLTSDTTAYFKVTFGMDMTNGPPSYIMTAVSGLETSNETDTVVLTVPVTGLTNGFGWLYFKLVGEGGPRVLNSATALNTGAPAIPKAAEWDILCTRTNENQGWVSMGANYMWYIAGRSSILVNEYKEVTAAKVADTQITDVLTVPAADTFSGVIDTAIGYKWYETGTGGANGGPTYRVDPKTFVIKTVEGNYAKFQPLTFAGPNSESFYMKFEYLYQADGATTFSK
ncbi:MAG: HmuY family protein [Treponema sp.]|jgi:hypothetical protein|nr:HmuY family protein [Treponema sp.]